MSHQVPKAHKESVWVLNSVFSLDEMYIIMKAGTNIRTHRELHLFGLKTENLANSEPGVVQYVLFINEGSSNSHKMYFAVALPALQSFAVFLPVTYCRLN